MKNLKKLILVLITLFAISCSKKDDAPAISPAFEVVNATSKPIPDAPQALAGSIVVPINIDKEGIIADPSKVTIVLSFSHPNSEDIIVSLVSPNNNRFTLIRQLNGNDNFLNSNVLAFNSSFIGSIPFQNNNVNIPAGNYKPTAGTLTNYETTRFPLSSMETFFKDRSIKGEWNLVITDYIPNNVGSFDFCKIKFAERALK